MDMQASSKAMVGLLKKEILDEMSDDERQRANTDLYFELFDKSLDVSVTMLARNVKVHVNSELVDFIQNQEGLQCKINDRLVSTLVTDDNDAEGEEEMEEELLED